MSTRRRMSAHWSMSVYTLGPRSGCHDVPCVGLSWLPEARSGQGHCTVRPTAGHRPGAALFDRRLHLACGALNAGQLVFEQRVEEFRVPAADAGRVGVGVRDRVWPADSTCRKSPRVEAAQLSVVNPCDDELPVTTVCWYVVPGTGCDLEGPA